MRSLTVALALVLPLAAHAARTVEMNDPATVELNTQASPAQVRKAVKLAVLNRKWEISNDKGGQFDATYARTDRNGTLMAKVRVTYSTKEVTIKYLASEGLGAEGNEIHPTYNKWIGNLIKDIPIYVEREVVASE